MTTEQKAKAYDEALNIAKETYETQPMYRAWLEKIFPELCESEDEKIRKKLIELIGYFRSKGIDQQLCEKFLIYLEKQKEQPKEELVYRLNGLMQEYIKEGKDEAEKEHRFKCYQLFWDALEDASYFEQKEQKPVVTHGETYHVDTLGTQQVIAGKMPQKIAELNNRLEEISRNGLENAHTIDFSKEYENSKQILEKGTNCKEWSEEDEEALREVKLNFELNHDNMTPTLVGFYERFFNKLKSLRSQSHWKPSEEPESVAERFARIVRTNLSKIDKEVQQEFEHLYYEITGNKMYGGYND